MIPFLDIGWGEAAVILTASLLGGVIRGFTGFGSALVMAPIVSLAVGPRIAVPAIIITLAISTFQLLPSALRDADRRRVVPLGIAGCVGVVPGVWLLMIVEPDLMRRFIALVVAVFAAAMLRGWRYEKSPGLAASAAAGGIGGVLTGGAAVGGPPVIAFLLSGPDRAAANRAAIIVYFLCIQFVAIGLYWAGDAITVKVLWFAALMLPAQMVGVWIGAKLFPLASEGQYRKFALGTLLVIGLVTLVL